MGGLGFWTPFFLAGIGLTVLPWLIHRIRRPERNTVEFSSLLFLPDIKKEVIERRRIQHPFLMALRMFLLLMLALAFARPYSFAEPEHRETTSEIHLILLDTSLSLSSTFEQAKEVVLAIVENTPESTRLGLITFSETPQLVAPLVSDTDDLAGTAQAVRTALDHVHHDWSSTDYVAGMAFSERHLLASVGADTSAGLTLHVISDFQESGMPTSDSGWRLTSRITFAGHSITPPEQELSIRDAAIVKRSGGHQVRARVRNTSSLDHVGEIRMQIVGRAPQSTSIAVAAGNTSQAVFDFELLPGQHLVGHVELEGSALEGDNTRYFAWNPTRRPVIATDFGVRDISKSLISAAVPVSRWRLQDVQPERVIDGDARLLITDRMDAQCVDPMVRYASDGGNVLVLLDSQTDTETWNRKLSEMTGIHLSPPTSGRSPTRLSEVSLDHPIFAPLSGPQFNDFSAIRYSEYVTAKLTDGGPARILASFENEDPAMIEVRIEAGTLILWTGGIHPSTTNLARSPRFIPLLHETLAYLTRRERAPASYRIGDPRPVVGANTTLRSVGRSGEETGAIDRLAEPGWLRWTEAGSTSRVAAVNVDPDEMDLTPIPATEFQLRLCDAEPFVAGGPISAIIPGETAPRVEQGFTIVLLIAVGLLIENLYAARLRAV